MEVWSIEKLEKLMLKCERHRRDFRFHPSLSPIAKFLRKFMRWLQSRFFSLLVLFCTFLIIFCLLWSDVNGFNAIIISEIALLFFRCHFTLFFWWKPLHNLKYFFGGWFFLKYLSFKNCITHFSMQTLILAKDYKLMANIPKCETTMFCLVNKFLKFNWAEKLLWQFP